jgi:curved DNA-binding protein
MDFYQVLGIDKTADEKDIKKAYRSLSLKHHPDRGGDSEKFKQLSEAYETLSDSSKRQEYDFQREHGGNGFHHVHMSGGGDMHEINEIFSMFFGPGGMPGMPGMPGMGGMGGIHFSSGGINIMPGIRINHMNQKPPTVVKHIPITLQQAYAGTTCTMDIAKDNGEKESVQISIPRGIDNGETICLNGYGNSMNGIRGDIHIIVEIKNEINHLERHGLDLVYKTNISLKDALCGFIIELEHVNGQKLTLNNKTNASVVKPGFKKVIPGMGMVRENNTGNLIIDFTIVFPDELTDEQIIQLEKIL